MNSVLQDWVMELPLMQQAVLCSALRGPDGMPKETGVKIVIRYLRGAVLRAARPEFVAQGHEDVFMIQNPAAYKPSPELTQVMSRFELACVNFLTDIDQYPIHFYMHLAHAAEIIGYNRPELDDPIVPIMWQKFYVAMCGAIHVAPESRAELNVRLKH